VLEAVLFAARDPLDERGLQEYFTGQDDIPALLEELQNLYAGRGVNLMRTAGKWAFRTAPDLSFLLERISVEPRRLSKAALETLAIIAYHQPVTRAEIEDVRGVSTSKGTLDVLLEMGWIRMRGRRRAPGRPVTYGTTDLFLDHFGFDSVKDLPGLSELKGAGLLDSNLPPGFSVPEPTDLPGLLPDEDPLDADDSGEENMPEAEDPLLAEDGRDEQNEDETPRPQVFNLLRRLQG
jgi:segregation and condensation protein B